MNIEEVNNPGYEQPRKGGRSWMACFGIGCVVLLVLCGAGAAITYFTAGDLIKMGIEQGQLHAESLQLAMENEALNEKIGSPVTLVGIPFPEVIPGADGEQTQKYRVDLQGPDGEAVLIIEYYMKPGQPVERRVFKIEVGDEVIDLEGDGGFELDVDDGGDMEGDGVELELEEPVGAGS